MGSKAPDPPPPPDPQETAAAQTGQNVSTAVANAFLGNVNQVTPQGTLSYEPTSTYTFNDPNSGETYEIPRFTATQELSPEQQQLQDIGTQTQQTIATIGRDQSARIGELLGQPVDLEGIPERYGADGFSEDRLRVEQALMERMQPYLDREREATRGQLANQGLMMGSEGYERGIDDYARQANDARLGVIGAAGQEQSRLAGLANQARGSAMQERFAVRNQPINEITALMSGSQVSSPNFMNTQMPQIPTTDQAGITQNAYSQQLARNRLMQQNQNNLLPGAMGGLFSLGAGALSGGMF